MSAMIDPELLSSTVVAVSIHPAELIVAGIILFIIGALIVLAVRWRSGRSDRAYFDSLNDTPIEGGASSLSSSSPEDSAAPLETVIPPRRNPAPTSEPRDPASDPTDRSAPDAQAAQDAMAELDRLLGNDPG
jgi:hypothetical protein